MTQPSTIAKELFSSHGDRLIRVRVAGKQADSFSSFSFPDTEVSGVMDSGEKRSALVLRSGVEIPVALPYQQLEQKIYQPDVRNDGTVLDLRDVTGEAAKPPEAHASALEAPANTNQAQSTARASVVDPGDEMPDGTVFAGVSPDTNKPMYVTPADASLTVKFNEAQEYAARLNAHGHKDWHLPTKAELNVLFNNRAAIGGFNVTGSYPAGWYWSSSSDHERHAWDQRFSDGYQLYYPKDGLSAVRCVR